MARLGDICAVVSGTTPKSTQPEYWDGNLNWVTPAELTDESDVIYESQRKITPQAVIDSSLKPFPAGTVLLSSRAPIGKVAITGTEMFCNQGFKNLICSDKIYNRYLYHFLKDKTAYLNSLGRGATFKEISKSIVENIEIPLPPLDEQRKIAAVLDKVSDLIAKRRQQLNKLDEMVKCRFIEMFGDISETVPLSYYIARLSAGKSLAGEEECPNKVLKTGAATYDYFDPTQVKSLPADYEPQEDHRVNTGDVIISRMNTAELVGAAAYVWEAPEYTYLPDRLWRAEIKETACPVFVWQMLIQSSTKESIRRIASGTSGSMKNISKPGLLGIRVQKVPLTLQEQFANFVEQTNKSKSAIQKSLEKLETLKKALMQEYFG